MEILGAIASSIALTQAVKGTLKAVDFLRQNSDMKKECEKLRKEILMIDCFIMQAREQTGQMMSAHRLLGIAEHPLVPLTIQELNEIAEKYSRSRKAHDPKRYTDKVKWFSDASKIEGLQERAQATKSNLHMAITFRVSSMVDRGNVRQELTYYTQKTHNISQTLPKLLQGPHPKPENSTASLQPATEGTTIHHKPESPTTEENRVTEDSKMSSISTSDRSVTTIKEESFVSVTTIQPLSTNSCGSKCQCRCHRGQRNHAGTWAGSLFYSWLVRYDKALSFVQDWEEVSTTKVHTAAAEGGVLGALREQPWAINELNEYGKPPIHVAVMTNNFEGLEQLIAAEADINRQDYFRRAPLMRAARNGNDTIVQTLLGYSECRRLIGLKDVDGETALHFAVESGSPACVILLLEAGASASKLDIYGQTPMHRLTWANKDEQEIDEIIELLQARGADIESKNNYGLTPTLGVCQEGNVPVLRALIRAGASIGTIDSRRRGILHLATISKNFDVVNNLAQQDLEGIDPQLRDLQYGNTPLGSLTWIFNEYQLPKVTIPTEDQQKDFIKLYFDLLIRDLERHISTLADVQEAIEDRDLGATTELLDILIKRNKAGFRQHLVDWYRGLQSYVSDNQWDYLKKAICEEYDETSEKFDRAAIARGKTLTDPEMEEFF
ncbi:ankyrin repeat-containing domain protein [Fusarium sp. MPI-SDFR-AT-0072]|nr:ankyrin repeat-containing domain protein [Fusarium sp. MPI-SDFR-AT-0072]